MSWETEVVRIFCQPKTINFLFRWAVDLCIDQVEGEALTVREALKMEECIKLKIKLDDEKEGGRRRDGGHN